MEQRRSPWRRYLGHDLRMLDGEMSRIFLFRPSVYVHDHLVMQQEPMVLHARRSLISTRCATAFRPAGGRHHFFPSRPFRATLSSIASASNRFSRVFWSSNAFSRLASEACIPTYFAFHL
jgi:hypothetical protein